MLMLGWCCLLVVLPLPAWPRNGAFRVDRAQTFVPSQLGATLVAPVQDCPGVWAAGLNYKRHAAEVGIEPPKLPLLFIKALNTLNAPYGDVVTPKVCEDEMDFEGEVAVVIGKTCKNVSEADAMQHVLGVAAANDISARKWQGKKSGGQWARSKSFDTFLPLGPGLVAPSSLPGGGLDLRIRTVLQRGGATTVLQDSRSSDMIFSIPQLLAFISQDTTLPPFSVIITGTPEGVGFSRQPPLYLRPSDVVTVELEGVGALVNRVV
jgi:2-keto-4-pentenoate hydratase/2-oxohepta-3-ene-1,7-dioic acid hydratase in catechol pathway